MVVLLDNGAKLMVAGIRFNDKWFVVIRVVQKAVGGNNGLHLSKGLFVGFIPTKCLVSCEFCEGSK